MFAALATTGSVLPGFVSPVRADVVTPAQWLQRQPKPVFKPGHTLPRLTRFGWELAVETQTVLAEDWNYVLQTNYLGDVNVNRALNDPNSFEGRLAALTLSDPAKYPYGVILSREEPPSPDMLTFLRDGAGNLIDGQQIYSPLNPQNTLDQMAELRARPLRNLRARVPINMILNGGEYGLGVLGFMQSQAERDPAVVAARNQSGDDWFNFISKAKANEMNTIAVAVRAAGPDRKLYIYYNSGNVERNRYWGWKDWSYDNSYALNSSDLPSNEIYYKHFNTGYLDTGDNNDMLTRALNATGFQIANGKKLSYDWLSNGWINENGGTNPPPVYNPAALVDPNAGQLGSNSIYTGLLKCLFTSGMIGGNAGYYEFPAGGFDGSFESSSPKYYLPQMTALSHVQALFSHLETDLRNSDLLPGPNMHAKSTEQPAYEFPTGNVGARGLVRKVTGVDRWIITAWAADGVDRTVNVNIPTLGVLALSARSAGNVYIATIVNNQMQLLLTDPNALTPTVGGYAPVAVTAFPVVQAPFADGGFETPVLNAGSFAYGPTGSAWNFASKSGIVRNGSSTPNAPNAPEGSQVAFVQGNFGGLGVISQAVSFTAGTYKLQFQAVRRNAELQPMQIKIDGVNVGTAITPSSSSYAAYSSAAFTVTAGSHTISFGATDGSGDKASYIDDVRLIAAPPVGIANGGFETPVLSDGTYVYTPTGSAWNFASNSGVQRNGGTSPNSPNAPEGSQAAFLQGNSSGLGVISQLMSIADGTYQLQFQAVRRYAELQPIQIKINGVNLGGTITPASSSYAVYNSAAFTVPAGSHTISFGATDGSGDKASVIDDVRLIAAPPVGIANGGFEAPDASGGGGYLIRPGGAGWNFVFNSGIRNNNGFDTVPNAPAGSQVAYLQSNGGLGEISQLLNLIAGTYKVQFQATRRSGQVQPIQVKIGGVNVGSPITPTSDSYALYTSAEFTAPGGNTTLSLSATDASGDKTTFVDDVLISASTPAMLVSGSGTLADGSGVYNYGTVNVNATLDHVFTINNAGAAKLTLTGSPYAVISGTNAADFSVTVQPAATVAAGSTSTFTVCFKPSAAGTRTATISIASNDAVTSPYTFNVTGSGLAIPAAPSTLAATRPTTSTRQINLTWKDNSGNESGFKIERATNSTFTTNLVQVATTAANVISYSNTGLAANTRYYYRVRATNAAGNSAYSNVVNALTGA